MAIEKIKEMLAEKLGCPVETLSADSNSSVGILAEKIEEKTK